MGENMTPPTRPSPVWRDGSFLRLMSAGGINMATRWLEILATSVFVYAMTASALVVVLVNLARFLPGLLFGVFTGAIADLFDRRVLMLVAQAIQALISACLCLISWHGLLSPWHVGIAAFVSGTVYLVDFPVRRTMIAEIAGIDRVGQAMGLDTIAFNAMRILGPAAGGLIYDTLGVLGVYAVSTTTYALCIIVISGIAVPPRARIPRSLSGLTSSVGEGLRHVFGNRALVGFMAVTVIMNLWALPYAHMVPVIGREILDLSAFPIGLLMSAEGVGGLVASLLIASYARPQHFRKLYVYGSAILVTCVILFSVSRVYELSLLFIFIGGVGLAGFVTMQSTLPYALAPPEMRARVMGVLSVCIGTGPIGMLHLGILAELYGTSTALTIMGLEGLVAVTAALLVWREIR